MSETYLDDPIADSVLAHADRLPEAPVLLERIRGGGRVLVRGLTGSARGYLAAWLQKTLGRTVLYVVDSGEAFEEARDDLEYFLGPASTLAFPEPDAPPYDPASPHPGLTANRLETLARLARGDQGVVLATPRGLLQRVPRP